MEPLVPIEVPISTARPKRRAVLLFGAALALAVTWTLIAWIQSGPLLPNDSANIQQLGDRVAIIDLYRHTDVTRAALEALGLPEDRYYGVERDGTIAPLDTAARSEAPKLPRSRRWILPTTIGELYIVETMETHGIGALSGTVSAKGFDKPDAYLPFIGPDTLSASAFDCTLSDCPEKQPLSSLPEGPAAHYLLSQEGSTVAATIFASEVDENSIEQYGKDVLRLAHPETQTRRLPDGNLIEEFVPAGEVDSTAVLQGTTTHTRLGPEDEGLYITSSFLGSVMSSSIELSAELHNQMSTLSWTNKVCGLKSNTYILLGNWPRLEQRLVLTRSRTGWRLCQEEG